jgi:hypothetical protein
VAAEYSMFESLFVWDDYTRCLLGGSTSANTTDSATPETRATANWQYPLVLRATRDATPYDLALCYDDGVASQGRAEIERLSIDAPCQTIHRCTGADRPLAAPLARGRDRPSW